MSRRVLLWLSLLEGNVMFGGYIFARGDNQSVELCPRESFMSIV